MNLPFKWELISKGGDYPIYFYSHRVKVPNGWLLANVTLHKESGSISESMTFIDDPHHEWVIDNE